MLDGIYQPIKDKKDKSDPVLLISITISLDLLFQPFGRVGNGIPLSSKE
jgi:hypothetical protein